MGVSFGMGGSQKDQTGNTRNYFLCDADGWSPSLDMVYRLSDMANQSNAQSNLLFGGAGWLRKLLGMRGASTIHATT